MDTADADQVVDALVTCVSVTVGYTGASTDMPMSMVIEEDDLGAEAEDTPAHCFSHSSVQQKIPLLK